MMGFLQQLGVPLNYLGDLCEVFSEDLLYCFYARAAFKLGHSAYPICLLVKYTGSPDRLFPTDSGALYHGRCGAFLPSGTSGLDEVELTGVPQGIEKVISAYYDSLADYVLDAPKQTVDYQGSTIAKKYHEMVLAPLSDSLDVRKSSIELILKRDLKFANFPLQAVLLPEKDYFDYDNGQVISFLEIKRKLEDQLACRVLGYKQTGADPRSYIYKHFQKEVERLILYDN
jgi:hypothetical protein